MISESIKGQKWLNVMQTLLLAALMVVLIYFLGRALIGGLGVLAVVAATVLLAFQIFRNPTRFEGVIPLNPYQAPDLYSMVRRLADRAALPRVPRLYLVPSPIMNAFTFGSRDDARLFVTEGLLRRLDGRELAGVMAHEISHIRHNDLLLFRLAELVKQTTLLLSRLGWLLLFFAVPLYLAGGDAFPAGFFAALLGAPIVTLVLQLALFRTREFSADLGAVELTRDPQGLASALYKIENPDRGLLSMFFPLPRREESSLFRSHPATTERIRRLSALHRA